MLNNNLVDLTLKNQYQEVLELNNLEIQYGVLFLIENLDYFQKMYSFYFYNQQELLPNHLGYFPLPGVKFQLPPVHNPFHFQVYIDNTLHR